MTRLWTTLLALLPAVALATQVSFTMGRCPLDGNPTRVYHKVSANTLGGWDSDLVSYSTQGQWREYALSTCTNDLYTVLGVDLETAPDPAVAPQVQAALAELRKRYRTETITPWERYRVAAELYRIQGRDPLFLAQLYLEASWTARDAAVGVYQGLNGPLQARALLDAGAAELAKPLAPRERKIVLHNLARIAHRGGWPDERDRYLDAFEDVGSLDADELAALQRFRRMAHDVEPALQRLAAAELRAWLLTNPSDPEARMRATYLLADLARRLGDTDQAVAGFALVATSSASPAQLRELSAWLGAQM